MKDFVDLRIDQHESQVSEGFWPSFTDIMTVIVMIFLLSMVVVQVQNMELVKQLQHSVESEKQAAEIARTTALEKLNLNEKLSDSESAIAMLRFQLQQSQHDNEQQQLTNREQKQQYTQLLNRHQAQQLNLQQLQTAREQLEELNKQQLQRAQQLSKQVQALNRHLQEQQNQLTTLTQYNQEKDQRIQSLQAQSAEQFVQYNQLADDHSVLQNKYEKLVKPARTAKGKMVAEVFHRRIGNVKEYKLKQPGQQNYSNISEQQLHATLTLLKQKYPKKLYIKIVFPEQSGLSYSEAWKFTNKMLVQYDSYYQTP